jgi:hypothetical protein
LQSRLVCIIGGLVPHGANISQTAIHVFEECDTSPYCGAFHRPDAVAAH